MQKKVLKKGIWELLDEQGIPHIVRDCRLALTCKKARDDVFNLGSGMSYSILDIAQAMTASLGKKSLEPVVNHLYRMGDDQTLLC